MGYLIETNIYILNRRPKEVIARFKWFEPGMIGVSTITVSELQYGAANSRSVARNRSRLDAFLAPLALLPYDDLAALAYGRIRFELERIGQPIGPLDQLIAAQAVSRRLVLVTNNVREFQRIEGLQIENWAE